MKQNFGRKIVLLIHWLMSLVLGGAMVALFFMNVLPVKAHGVMVIAFAITALIIYLIFALGALLCIFPELNRWRRRNFVTITASGLGSTRISLSAVNQVISQAVRGTAGIADLKADIVNNDDNIEIDIDLTVEDDAHIPTVTSTIQTAVRELVESKCGVEVKSVVVSVHSIKEDEPEPAANVDESGSVGAAESEAGSQETVDVLNATVDGGEVKPEAAEEEPLEVEIEEPEYEPAASDTGDSGDEEWLAGLEDEVPEFEENPADAEAAVAGDEEQGDGESQVEQSKTEETVSEPAPGQGISRSAKRRRRRKKKLMAKMQAEKETTSAESVTTCDAGMSVDEVNAEPKIVEEDFDTADAETEEAGEDSTVVEAEFNDFEDGFDGVDAESEEAGESFDAVETQPVYFEGDSVDNTSVYGDTVSDVKAETEEVVEAEIEAEGDESEVYDEYDAVGDADFNIQGEARQDADAALGETEYPDEGTYDEADDFVDDADLAQDDAYTEEAAEVTEYYADDTSDASEVDSAQEFASEEVLSDSGYEGATLRLDDEAPYDYDDEEYRQTDDGDTTY